jgi:CRISPR/Cas system CSM-associated protein Csm4 (group 5 of RAMP superfamily)
MDGPDKNVPVFVKINDYKEILDIVDVMKQKLNETRKSITKINQLKEQENQEIDQWEKNVAEITKRLSFIDSAFFEND